MPGDRTRPITNNQIGMNALPERPKTSARIRPLFQLAQKNDIGRCIEAAVVLDYRAGSSGSGEWKSVQQRVPIRLTACHLGGQRPWFVCSVHPNDRYCGRRAAILCGAGELFGRRRCYGLSYASQQQTALHRGLEESRKIRMRLGGSADLLEPFPAKPKGMHRWIFQRLRARAEAAMYRSNRALQPRIRS
jgi:hypothetical protein